MLNGRLVGGTVWRPDVSIHLFGAQVLGLAPGAQRPDLQRPVELITPVKHKLSQRSAADIAKARIRLVIESVFTPGVATTRG